MLDNRIYLLLSHARKRRIQSNKTMDIDEVQYLSENEFISVVPNFKHPEIHLIRGSVGPFLPLVPLQVPMWMVCYQLFVLKN
jgi:hypothetical protein